METTGQWLTRQMERRQITVRQVADALDVATQTVYNWQSGKSVINEERVPRLADVLGVSELEARRGLGFWVPRGESDTGRRSQAELDELRAHLEDMRRQLDAAIQRLEQHRPG